MDLNTTTFNIDELITSFADNQISDTQTKHQIEDLLNKDQKLNAKYQSEVLTKNLLRARFPEAELPAATYEKVIALIDSIIAGTQKKNNAATEVTASQVTHTETQYPTFWQSIKETFTEKIIGVPRYAFAVIGLVIIGGLVVFTGSTRKTMNPYILSGNQSSVMVQAVNSFHKFINGDIKPQLSSGNAAEVEKYVMEKAHFDPYVPEIDNYQIAGVVCNEYQGQELAHIIYKDNDGRLIYIFQVPLTAINKKSLNLPDDVQKEIIKAKFYMCDEVDETDCTMMLWYKDNNVCASMTTMPKQEMFATFTRFNK